MNPNLDYFFFWREVVGGGSVVEKGASSVGIPYI